MTAVLNAADALLGLFAYRGPATPPPSPPPPSPIKSDYQLRHRKRKSPRFGAAPPKRRSAAGKSVRAPPKFEVNRLIRRKYVDNRVLYLVKWADGSQTLEPRSRLVKDVPALVRAFEK